MIELINKNKLKTFIGDSSEKLNKANRKINGKWVAGTYIPTMSTFKEIDTGNYYIFNANGGDTYVYKDIYSKIEKTYYLGEWIEVNSVPENIQYTCLSTELTKFNNNKANRVKNKTKYISKGERCFTLDTKTIYVFDELNNKWVENKFKENIGGSTGSSIDSKELNRAVENYISTNKIGADNIKIDGTSIVKNQDGTISAKVTVDDTKVNNAVDNYINTNGIKAEGIKLNDNTTVEDTIRKYLYEDVFTLKNAKENYGVSSVGKLQAKNGVTTSDLILLQKNKTYYFPDTISTITLYKEDGTFIKRLSLQTDYKTTPSENIKVRLSWTTDESSAEYREPSTFKILTQKDEVTDDTIFLEWDNRYKNIRIYMKTKKDWLKYTFKNASRNSTEKASAITGGETLASCYNMWRQRGVYRVIKNIDNTFNDPYPNDSLIHSVAEWEMAIKEVIDGTEQPDFVGGMLHGDEVTTSVVFMVDGKIYTDVTQLQGLTCKKFKIFRNSDVYRCGTLELDTDLKVTAGTKIATHYTDYTYKNGELIINQNLKWLVNTTCNYSTMAMLGVRRTSETNSIQISNKGLREGEGIVYDCSVAGFSNALSNSLNGCKKGYLWNDGTVSNNSGWDCSFSAEVLEETQLEGKNFKVSNNDGYNKMYFGYCKEGQTVKNGDIWHSKAKYKIDFNGEY